MTHALVVATHNRGKLDELRALLGPLGVQVLSVADVTKREIVVVEDGDTFEANAKKKAVTVAGTTMMLTIADDSGLEVDALGGAPGVRSARFAGERATDAENNAALLTALGEVDDMQRTARFRCELALFDPWGKEPLLTEGTCEGRIAREGRGAGGFGYDPLFLVTELGDRAMAELSDDEKNQVSHRGRAAKALRPHLEAIVAERLSDVERVSQRRPSILDR